ncbi:MAG TPA: precorrin-6A reductase [Clostridiales bacterium]|nr:precorrin-6A reductase [Clostridiales bacterium]
MSEILIFAGTAEGRSLAEELSGSGIWIHVCVATEYGEKLLPKGEDITVTSSRLDAEEMGRLMKEEQVSLVIDATHPYAVIVSENIKKACKESGKEYLRLLRDSLQAENDNILYVESVEEAAGYLKGTEGNVLLTTGSKELAKYTCVPDYKIRFYARVLSTPEVVAQCAELGFEGKNLICMQGPFSEELNYAMLKQIDARYLVTKESGKAGGFLEKINAVVRAGVKMIVIGRPGKEEGLSYGECLKLLVERYGLKLKQHIALVGIGMGSPENMTIEAAKACGRADLLIGAGRILGVLKAYNRPVFEAYKPAEIRGFIQEHPEYKNIVVALSGDTGFYSGAKKLLAELKDYEVTVLPGISSCVYLCALLKTSWEDVRFYSIHGREENILHGIRTEEKIFTLLGGKQGVKELCRKLMDYGYTEVILSVGERLSYPEERIWVGTPGELIKQDFSELCAVLIENPAARNSAITHGLPDEAFIRGKVPMTKEEVRTISVSKMRLKSDSVIYDIGAGTGSVAVEMALLADKGRVFAIEKKEEAVQLIEENKRKFCVDNLEVIRGTAPEAMKGLPVPTHAFVGGSSGNLRSVLTRLLDRNPGVRVVINAVALETVAEATSALKALRIENAEFVQASISKAQTLGGYHMMMGQNPVYIIAFSGGSGDGIA